MAGGMGVIKRMESYWESSMKEFLLEEGPTRIFITGLPYHLTEAQIKELLESFGPLRGFELVKDIDSGKSKGYAFCEYHDLFATDVVCAALNEIKLGDNTLTVRRATKGDDQTQKLSDGIQTLMLEPKVVCVTQMVIEDELIDDEVYQSILVNMQIECGKFGRLVSVVIPRPNPNGEPVSGVGKVFLEYADTESASKARLGLNGRKSKVGKIVAIFYPENKFNQGEYDGKIDKICLHFSDI